MSYPAPAEGLVNMIKWERPRSLFDDVMIAKSTCGTAHGDYIFTKCLNRCGFQAIPYILEYEDQAMAEGVEGRRP